MVIRNGCQIIRKQHRVIHLPPVGQVSRLFIWYCKTIIDYILYSIDSRKRRKVFYFTRYLILSLL